MNWFASTNCNFSAFTTRNANGTFTFFWWNAHTDDAISIMVTSSNYSGSSAEWILERPKMPNGNYAPLAQMLNPSSTFTGSANGQDIAHFAHVKVDMYNGATKLAGPGGLANRNTFTVTQSACQ